jgi:DNA replicative helicase MCM subunit Mcm2 (Cdc46/Mcm family)
MSKKNVLKMREIKAKEIGSLVTIRGIVVRASDVKP